MLDRKSKKYYVAGTDGGRNDGGAARDDLFAFEPAAQKQIARTVARDRVQAGCGRWRIASMPGGDPARGATLECRTEREKCCRVRLHPVPQPFPRIHIHPHNLTTHD